MDAFPHSRLDQLIAALAGHQHGVVALWQLTELGLTPSAARARAATGRLHRVHRSVYAVGHKKLSREGRWMAAVLAHGATAVLSHWDALALWSRRPVAQRAVHVTVPASGLRSSQAIHVHNVRELDPHDRTTLNAIPVTSVHRSLLDIAEVASARELGLALDAADRRELLDLHELEAQCQRTPGRHGIANLRTSVAQLLGPAPWTQSEFERHFRALAREAGLPEPQFNVPVAGEVVDAFWPHARLVVELDTYGTHGGRTQFETDRRRDIRLTLAGYRVIRITQRRLTNEPERVALELATLLRGAA